jgi:hypothetical protein
MTRGPEPVLEYDEKAVGSKTLAENKIEEGISVDGLGGR